jgi:hypothetical protein
MEKLAAWKLASIHVVGKLESPFSRTSKKCRRGEGLRQTSCVLLIYRTCVVPPGAEQQASTAKSLHLATGL